MFQTPIKSNGEIIEPKIKKTVDKSKKLSDF
jgi:hypothetical protein